MPMIELTAPKGALDNAAQDSLAKTLTDTLLKWEGAPVDNPVAQAISWLFVDEKEQGTFYVAGAPIREPHWKVKITVPEGVLDDEKKAGLVADVTQIVADFTEDSEVGPRTWCIIREVKDGNWGSDGEIFRRRDIVKAVYAK